MLGALRGLSFGVEKHRFVGPRNGHRILRDDERFGIKRTALGDIVNLKRFRKTLARNEADRQASANRALFGRSRADREHDEREQQKLNDVLDQHQIEDKDR